VDIHDHLRQGSLRLKISWLTKTWWHRLFSTVFGIIVTDCFFAHKLLMSRAHQPVMTFPDFVDKLAYQLIFNNVVESPATTVGSTIQNNIPSHLHQLHPLIDLPYYENIRNHPYKRARRRCSVCHNSTSFFCMQCSNISDETEPQVVCLCSVNGHTCFQSYNHGL
jgi:hypothetical protein